jgi:hypothetical protein
METIFDHNPTPFEMHHLGYTEEEDSPITDEVRANVLLYSNQESHWLEISDLMAMRNNREARDAYLQRLPPNHPDRRFREKMHSEWDWLHYPEQT